jgi:lipopolysaccharide transport protein LptA
MNLLYRIPLLIAALLLTCSLAVQAQTPDAGGTEAPPPGSTVITSDELHSDQLNHVSTFTGSVVVTGSSFNMACDEMKVIFTKDGKVDHIIASGNVVITQPGRITHSGQCEYFREDDKFVLTDEPVIVQDKNKLSAPKITIYRTTQTLETSGKSTTVLGNGGGLGSSTPASAPAGPLPDK